MKDLNLSLRRGLVKLLFSCIAFGAYSNTGSASELIHLETSARRLEAIYKKNFKNFILANLEFDVNVRQGFEEDPNLYQIELEFTDIETGQRILKTLTDVFKNIDLTLNSQNATELYYSVIEYQFNLKMKFFYTVLAFRKDIFHSQPLVFAQRPFWNELPPLAEISEIFPSGDVAQLKSNQSLHEAARAFAKWLGRKTLLRVEVDKIDVIDHPKRIARGEFSAKPGSSLVVPFFQFYDSNDQLVLTEGFSTELAWEDRLDNSLTSDHIHKFYLELLRRIDLLSRYHNYYGQILGFSKFREELPEFPCSHYYRWLGISPDFEKNTELN